MTVVWHPSKSCEIYSHPRQNSFRERAMTNLQLLLSVSIPSILILVGIFLNNARFNTIEARLTTMEGDLRSSIVISAGTMLTSIF
jgi:hypothetical protein